MATSRISAGRGARSFVAAARDAASNVPLMARVPIGLGLVILLGQVCGVRGTSWATQESWLYSCVLLSAPVLCAVRAVRFSQERVTWAPPTSSRSWAIVRSSLPISPEFRSRSLARMGRC